MLKEFKYTLYVVESNIPKKTRKKHRERKYTGLVLEDNFDFYVSLIPEGYNRLGQLIYMMNDLIAINLVANIGDGFRNNERTDFRDIDSFEVMEKAKKKYESYCLIATDDTELCNCPLWNGEEKYKAIPITLYINNKGTTKNPKGGCFMRYNFSMTNKNPKNDRNHRNKNIMKAYNMSWKFDNI